VTDEEAIGRLADRLLGRAAAFALMPLEGIEQAAAELVALAEGDRRVVERSYREARALAVADPTTVNKQIVALIRRVVEVGDWDWSDATTGDATTFRLPDGPASHNGQ
jgi:hypothetical protein